MFSEGDKVAKLATRAALDSTHWIPHVEYDGDDPLGFVISHNLHRRHLTESQRVMVAAKLANMPEGRNWNNSANLRSMTSQAEASDMLNVSDRTITTAKKVHEQGSPELVAVIRTDCGERQL